MFKNVNAETLTVLYDASCGFCVSCRRWLEEQPAYLPLQFVPARSQAAAELFPELAGSAEADELTVVSNEGLVYRGASAWIMCLWALQEFRGWARRLAAPALLPFARQAFELLSRNRKSISRELGLLNEAELVRKLSSAGPVCGPPAPSIVETRPGAKVLRIFLLALLVWSAWRLSVTYREPILFFALDRGVISDARTLRRAGLDVDSAFLKAVRQGRADRVRALLDAGVNRSAVNNFFNDALVLAAREKRGDVVNLLRAAGFDPNVRSAAGHTALMGEAAGGTPQSVRNLLDAGADPNAEDNLGRGPLAFAVESGRSVEVVRELISAGARVDAPDASGQTPLMAAARLGRTEIACALLDAGASPDLTDRNGKTAPEMATERHPQTSGR